MDSDKAQKGIYEVGISAATILKPYEPTISIERVFNLGDYKSFRVKVFPSDMSDAEKELVMLKNIFDAHKQFLLNQIIEARMYGKDTTKWGKALETLEALKTEFTEEV